MEENEEQKKGWIREMIQREATPKPERTETVAEFCKKHGISDSTYDYQKSKKENKKQIIQIWLNEAIDGGNEVLRVLKQNALDGKEKSLEMYLKFILQLAENLDIKTDGEKITRFTDEQIETIARRIINVDKKPGE
jgi:hypothetical protein